MFDTVLIANRGEIACRIADVLRQMGIRTVGVYSDADAEAPHVKRVDEAVHIGPSRATDSYLDAHKILEAARKTGAQAIHPGYGFLSERASFARACAEAGIVFIGPSPEAMEAMGDKARARATARAAGCPVVPGTEGTVEGEAAHAAAREIGFPILVKASAGGGGIGMTVAEDEAGLDKALKTASGRAQASFGDGSVYLERYFARPRHIEVQVLGDGQDTYLHLFERECSIQRRHQKVIEEAPSPLFEGDATLAEAMYRDAVAVARAVSYVGAGTVEMLVADGAYHFIEMNTRLQVEHPVTELTTGVDLIAWQVRIAAGEALDLKQADLRRHGHALELRIYAEDPDKKFFPSPGTLTRFEVPTGEGVRVDAGVETGYTVTPFYDPMIAKPSSRGRIAPRPSRAPGRPSTPSTSRGSSATSPPWPASSTPRPSTAASSPRASSKSASSPRRPPHGDRRRGPHHRHRLEDREAGWRRGRRGRHHRHPRVHENGDARRVPPRTGRSPPSRSRRARRWTRATWSPSSSSAGAGRAAGPVPVARLEPLEELGEGHAEGGGDLVDELTEAELSARSIWESRLTESPQRRATCRRVRLCPVRRVRTFLPTAWSRAASASTTRPFWASTRRTEALRASTRTGLVR